MAFVRSDLWLDANGKLIIRSYRTAAGAAAIDLAVGACSNATQFEYWEGPAVNPGGSPVVAQYQSNLPVAQLLFICADATIAYLSIPAPQVGIFLADQATINLANPLIVLLIAACLVPGAELLSATGSPATAPIGGRLID